MPTVSRTYTGKSDYYIQSVRFKKENWTKYRAIEFCKKHDYYIDGLDITDNEFRFRQYDPNDDKFKYYTKESAHKGMYYIMGERE